MVTGLTCQSTGVVFGDLREVLRLGGAGCMAADTQHGSIQFGGLHGGWIVGMVCQWPVACLTVHSGVLSAGFGGSDVGVAGLAGLMAGKVDGLRCDLRDGSATIVSILAECLWHHEMAQEEEDRKSDHEEKCESEEVSRILKNTHWVSDPCVVQAWRAEVIGTLIDRCPDTRLYVTQSTRVRCGWAMRP